MYTLVRVYVCGYVCTCGRTVDTSVDACASMYVCVSVNIHAGPPGVTRNKGIHHSSSGHHRPRTRQQQHQHDMTFIDKTRKTSRPARPLPIAGTWVAERGAVTVTVWSPCSNASDCPAISGRAVRSLHLDSGGRVVSVLERWIFASSGAGGWCPRERGSLRLCVALYLTVWQSVSDTILNLTFSTHPCLS